MFIAGLPARHSCQSSASLNSYLDRSLNLLIFASINHSSCIALEGLYSIVGRDIVAMSIGRTCDVQKCNTESIMLVRR